MKILIFAGYFYPHIGGYENHIYQFSEQLSKKHQVSVLTTNTNSYSDYEKINKNFDIYRIPVWNALNGAYPIFIPNKEFFKIWNKLKKQKWDVVMTRTRFFTTSFLGLKFSKKQQIPLIHYEHGSCHTVSNSKIVEVVNKIYDHTIGKSIAKNAKLNVGLSKGACKFLKHLGAKEPLIIYRGIELKNLPKHKPKKQIKNLIFVGRLIYAKGVQDLIVAFSELIQKDKDLKLTIVGDGHYRKNLQELVKRLNLQTKVIFIGEKNKKEVMRLLSQSDLFINPSYSEGLPTSVLEAGAIGLPVIATDVGGTNEIVINKKTGLLIKEKAPEEIKEAIEFLLKNKKRRTNYSKNLNKLIKTKFNWKKIMEKWDGIIRKAKD